MWDESQQCIHVDGETLAKVSVWDSDAGTMDDLIGDGSFKLNHILTHFKGHEIISLHKNGELAGKITLAYKFYEDSSKGDQIGNLKEEEAGMLKGSNRSVFSNKQK